MGGSIKIGNVFGIPVRIHWTFLVLLYVFLLLAGGSVLERLAGVVALFGSVFLHELGHSLVARRFGIRVLDITFWPLGGMARMSEIPENARVEGAVAIAGPAVNFVLAALGGALALLAGVLGFGAVAAALSWFLGINLLIGTFNLVPAFPMDGGRLLRAWFARRASWLVATERAVRVGRACAVLMFVTSLVIAIEVRQAPCALPLIAIFVWFAGARELLSVRLRHGLGMFGMEQGGDAGRAAEPEWHARSESRIEPLEDTAPPPEGARRPRIWKHGDVPRGGFTEVDVRDLEEYHGRLFDE